MKAVANIDADRQKMNRILIAVKVYTLSFRLDEAHCGALTGLRCFLNAPGNIWLVGDFIPAFMKPMCLHDLSISNDDSIRAGGKIGEIQPDAFAYE
jgi:hypothetical protein